MSEIKKSIFEQVSEAVAQSKDEATSITKEKESEKKEMKEESKEVLSEQEVKEEKPIEETVKESKEVIETSEIGETADDLDANFETTPADETNEKPSTGEEKTLAVSKQNNEVLTKEDVRHSIAVAQRPNVRPTLEPQHTINASEYGNTSTELEKEELQEREKAQREYNGIGKLELMRRNKRIGWARIEGFEPIEESDTMRRTGAAFVIIAKFDGVKILIPDNAFFESTFNFGKYYPSLNDKEKARVRLTVAQKMIGAKICFIPLGISGDENEPFAVASRIEAMKQIRDTYFLNKEGNKINGLNTNVKVGTLATANVLLVMEKYILVECLGVETRIDDYNVNNEYVENCNDFFKSGDKLTVKVRKLYINQEEKNVYLAVTGRTTDVPAAIKTMKQRGIYMGTVDHYTKRSGVYTIVLSNGVEAKVKADKGVLSSVPLCDGDRVSVMVTGIYETNVRGIAKKA